MLIVHPDHAELWILSPQRCQASAHSYKLTHFLSMLYDPIILITVVSVPSPQTSSDTVEGLKLAVEIEDDLLP